jgi:concentrative nucleoside transporter, CNT family
MDRFIGLIGIAVILLIAIMMSNNRRAINLRTVIVGLILQWLLAFFILKVPLGKEIFQKLGEFITMLLNFSRQGAAFVLGSFADPEALNKLFGVGKGFVFAIQIAPTIILICSIVGILYYLGIMQRIVAFFAKIVAKLMHVSGAEALSNVASVFVGQVEAQVMIRPYVSSMTMSELLASMAGSMACISGGVMALYIGLGIKAEYLLAASLMAAPGAFVISKIVWPETETPKTRGVVTIEEEKTDYSIIDAAANGCSVGMKISINVIAMLVGFIALLALLDWAIGWAGIGIAKTGLNLSFIGIDLHKFTLSSIFGVIFAPIAFAMGVPTHDILTVGGLMGTKIVATELVAYLQFSDILNGHTATMISHKAAVITSFALCGFANFGSIAIQIGGIGAIAPSRKHDIAALGVKALICGTLASYMSATIAGIILG